MDYGYKAFLALTLATAACWRAKAQNSGVMQRDNFVETVNNTPTEPATNTIPFDAARAVGTSSLPPFLENGDSMCVTSALVERPNIEEDSIPSGAPTTGTKTNAQLIAPEVLDSDNKTPWETTAEGMEILQTWQRLQRENGNYTSITAQDVVNLQKINNTSHRVCALEAGLQSYEMDGEDMLRANTDSMGVELEKSAVREANGPGERCYRWVKHIVMGTNPIAYLEGSLAREGAAGLQKSPNLVGTITSFEHMDKLVPGAIIVFGSGPGARAGHILISGAGKRDLLKSYETEWGKKYWYSPARDVSDKNRSANVTGNRGSRGHYAPKPQVFFTKNSTVAGVTMLKIGYQYTKENTSLLFISTQDVYNSILRINMHSAEMAANKIIEAQQTVNGFVRAENQTAYHQYPNPRVSSPRTIGRASTKKKAQTRRAVQQRTSRGHTGRT
ncbi:MAG: hypothetical protein IJ770_00435 [Alphaproteobacteria bacterium]|nr:hypothetical protein [Alphaproteobacteria bacterium]